VHVLAIVERLVTMSEGEERSPKIITPQAVFSDVRQYIVGLLLGQIGSALISAFVGLSIFWIAVFVFLITALLLALFVWYRFREIRRALANFQLVEKELKRLKANNDSLALLAELDDSMLRLIPEVVGATDKARAMRNLQEGFLRDVTKLFRGDVHRASILRPDEDNLYLVRVASIGMPGRDNERTDQYIGPDSRITRGSAGKAFNEKRVVVTLLPDQERGEKGNTKETEYLKSKERRVYVPYKACVSVPIIVGEDNDKPGTCLGVFCLDSMKPDVFNTTDEILYLIGRRIAAGLKMYENLNRRRGGARRRETIKTE
jgi:hypothetical protein